MCLVLFPALTSSVDTVITPILHEGTEPQTGQGAYPAHTFSNGEAAASPHRLAPELLLWTTALPWGVAPARCGGISEV